MRLRKNNLNTFVQILILIEAVIFAGSIYLATELRFLGETGYREFESVRPILPQMIIHTIVMLISMAAMGLYQARSREESIGMFLRVIAAFFLGAVLSILIFYFLPDFYLGRGVFLLAALLSLLTIGTVRPIFFQFLDQRAPGHRVLVLGAGKRAAMILQRLRRTSDRRGMSIVGFLASEGDLISVDDSLLVEASGTLPEIVSQFDIDELVVAHDDRRRKLPMKELLDCKLAGVSVIELPTLFERQTGKLKLQLLAPSWLIFSEGFNRDPISLMAKRTFDMVSGVLLCVAASPIMLLTALAIWMEDGFKGPILYHQSRVGEGEKLFDVLKFRSMRTDAEADGKARWAALNDDRITRTGRFIRKVRIDELPQIWNVLKGEMSFVGPRPERPEFVEKLKKSIPYYGVRHTVKPGLTGWAQLSYPYGENEKDAAEKLKFDLYYVKNRNLRLDIAILLRTVEVVLFRKGAR